MSGIMQLEYYYLKKLYLQFYFEDELPEGFSPNLEIDYQVAKHCEKDNSFMLTMRYRLNETHEELHGGIVIETEIIGIFECPPDIDKGKIEYLVRYNGLTILYGILRGQLSTFTGSFPAGRFILPTIDMRKVIEEVEAAKSSN